MNSPFLTTGVAQLVEYWSPKPLVVGSNPTARAKLKEIGKYCRISSGYIS